MFCRITQMGLLRLLTNRNAMGVDVIDQARAWAVYQMLAADWRVRYFDEPDGWKAPGGILPGSRNRPLDCGQTRTCKLSRSSGDCKWSLSTAVFRSWPARMLSYWSSGRRKRGEEACGFTSALPMNWAG